MTQIQESAAKHTPGPVHIGGSGSVVVYAADGYAIANAMTYHGKHDDVANGSRIVQCWNSHDALVDALRDAQLCFGKGPASDDWWEAQHDDYVPDGKGSDDVRRDVLERCAVALAAAGAA